MLILKTMDSIIYRSSQGKSTVCSFRPLVVKNARLLRPLGQLIKALEAQVKNHGFDHAVAKRDIAGELVFEVNFGMTQSFHVQQVVLDFARGRSARVVIQGRGLSPESISLFTTPHRLVEWIGSTADAGCICRETEDARSCNICGREEQVAAA